ncbi:MAG: hypothetical protein WBB28_28190 [Crinalium sp.]
MSNVVSILEPRNITSSVVDNRPTRSNLRARYDGIHERTFCEWQKFLELDRPKSDGCFKLKDVILLDEFWIALKILRVSKDEFKNAVMLTEDGSFEKLLAEYTEIPLIDYLRTSTKFNQHPVVLDTIARIETRARKNKTA